MLIKTKKLQMVIIGIGCLAAAVLVLFIFNAVETAPQQLPVETPPQPLSERAIESATSSKAVPVAVPKEYPKQVIIPLKSWSDMESAKKIITDNGGQIVDVLDWPTGNVIIAILPDKKSEEGILKNTFWGKLAGGIGFTSFGNKLSGGIDLVFKDIKVYPQQVSGMTEVSDALWGVKRINANQVWRTPGGATGKGVKIAIIDSGIQRDHPDLITNIKGGINFGTNKADGQVHPDQWDDKADNGHGTHVAGIAAGKINTDTGISGVAPEASLYAVRVMGADDLADFSSLISGIKWVADNGMQIANMSVGLPGDQLLPIYKAQEQAAVDYAESHGVILVGSAGNGGPSSEISWPANAKSVISVGGTEEDDTLAWFSPLGSDLVAPGSKIIAAGLRGALGSKDLLGISYSVGSGSSDAAPFVAGVAALILEKNPQFTPAQVRERLFATAIDLGASGIDTSFGHGLVNALDSVITRLPVTINLVSPRGGEQWLEGTQQQVVWTADNLASYDEVDISLIHQRVGTADAISLAKGVANSGKAFISVPTKLSVTDADVYFLQVNCGQEFVGECQSAQSEALNVTAAPPQAFTVTSPNGGERWPQGTNQAVSWTANYLGTMGVDITLFHEVPVPQYSLIPGSETRRCYNGSGYCLSGWDRYSLVEGPTSWSGGYSFTNPPEDTCDGNRDDGGPVAASRAKYASVVSCPATNDSTHLTCTDVVGNWGDGVTYWASTVNCDYKISGYVDTPLLVETLATNVANTGSAKISVPSNRLGDNYYIQLYCANFTGDCTSGLSSSPFSIIHLNNPTTLNIYKSGIGLVTDGKGDCESEFSYCWDFYEKGTVVTLTATSTDPTVIFAGWSGNNSCSGIGPCQITLDSDQSVTATFSQRAVTLTAVADPGTRFTGWSGECLNNGTCFVSWSSACATDVSCNLTLSSDQAVTANFVRGLTLLVEKNGTGTGTIKSPLVPVALPGGGLGGGTLSGGSYTRLIDCGFTCSATYSSGKTETLTAAPNLGSTFDGWSGACTGTGTCTLTMDSDKSVIATFTNPNVACVPGKWDCSAWSPADCAFGSTQTRTCAPTCKNETSPSPPTSQPCSVIDPGDLKEVNPSN